MEDLIKFAKDNWNNPEELQTLLLDITERYYEVGQSYGTATASFAQQFIIQKEESYKSSIAETEYRVKSEIGGVIENLREELTALSFLFKAVDKRIDWLSLSLDVLEGINDKNYHN